MSTCLIRALVLTQAMLLASEAAVAGDPPSLAELRQGHKTKLVKTVKDTDKVSEPGVPMFKRVMVPGELGKMAAFLSVPDHEHKDDQHKHPAMIWITGGFPPGGVGRGAWQRESFDNAQSAKSYRLNGMIMMYPWLRGAGGNPGAQEGFYGEVDDILAAAKFLAKQPGVDPKRIYLGGHSTGGTLVLLVAAMQAFPFKAVVSFGPVSDPASYGEARYDPKDEKEARLRAPIHVINAIDVPTFVVEGDWQGNKDELEKLKAASKNPKVSFAVIEKANHFQTLKPLNDHFAKVFSELPADKAPSFTEAGLNKAYIAAVDARNEVQDLSTLARVRASGVDIRKPCELRWYLISRKEGALKHIVEKSRELGFKVDEIKGYKDSKGKPYFVRTIRKTLTLTDLPSLFAASKQAWFIADFMKLQYDGWGVVTDE